jgi:substrate import-associated zinc metallohydrolase lipoprotein
MKIRYYLLALTTLFMVACEKDSLDSKSIFPDVQETNVNEFDKWLQTNFQEPYNILLKYRFEFKESDETKNLAPAAYDKSIALAKLTKYLWLESYEELKGRDFIRKYCPKIMHFIGSYGYNSGGSVTLGVAEGGMKITLYNVNNIDYENPDIEFLNFWFFKTMHHEFAHILHQTKPYPTDFNEISASNYQSESWVNLEENEWLALGFITDYASRETQEDFVELIANYITHDQTWWDEQLGLAVKYTYKGLNSSGSPVEKSFFGVEPTKDELKAAGLVTITSTDIDDSGRGFIESKLDIVRDWLKSAWDIDLDKLRTIVQRRSANVPMLDLQSLN